MWNLFFVPSLSGLLNNKSEWALATATQKGKKEGQFCETAGWI